VVQRGVDGELALQNLAVDHGDQRGAEVVANLDQLTALYLQVVLHGLALLALQILVLGVEGRIKSRLQGVGVDNLKLFEHDQARCRLFIFFVRKLTIGEGEVTVFLGEEVGHHLDEVVVLMLIDLILTRDAPVHENVAFATVTVHIAKEYNLILFVVRRHQFLREVNRWV